MQIFETSDTPTAAYLVCLGHETKEFNWRDRSCYISFEDTIKLGEDMTVLASGEACVEPLQYNQALMVLRSKIFSSKPAGVR